MHCFARLVEELLYVHRNRRLIKDGEPRTATSTFTQLLNSVSQGGLFTPYTADGEWGGQVEGGGGGELFQSLLVSSRVRRVDGGGAVGGVGGEGHKGGEG